MMSVFVDLLGERGFYWASRLLPALALVSYLCAPSSRWLTKKTRHVSKRCDDKRTNVVEMENGFMELIRKKCRKTGQSYMVIGGAGFLGKRLVEILLARGETKVAAFDIVKESPFSSDVEYFSGNILDSEALATALQGIDVVIFTAALIRFMDRMEFQYKVSHDVNVNGTQTVFEACVAAGIKTVLYCSTSHVAVPMQKSPDDIYVYDETSPLVTKATSPNHYGITKALAEKIAISFDGKAGMHVGIIRPCSGIFGLNDRLILQPDVVEGEATLMIPETILDWIFVDNLCYAFFLLENAIHRGKDICGVPICVSNGEPMTIDQFHNSFSEVSKDAVGREVKIIYAPRRFLYGLAYFVDFLKYCGATNLGKLGLLTPAMIDTASISHVLKSDRAKKSLGYEPFFTVRDGMRKTCLQAK